MKHTRTLARLGVLPAAAVLGIAIAGPASAHVTITPSETAAGAYTVLTVGVPHGCEGSPTTKVAIQMPDGINSVTPTRNPFYDVEKVMQKLDEPIEDAHGNELTERVDQVVYTARTPLPDGQRDSFELSLQLPADAAGQTLVFPSVQTCEQGRTAWTQVAADGDDAEELETPAPTVTVTEATEDAHGAATEDSADTASTSDGGDATAASPVEDGEDRTDPLAVTGLVAGLLGLALGSVALARTRGRSRA